MQREIKFRAWDKNNKCWYHSPQLVIRPYSGKVHDGATTPNVELMQYTGLKDKNGKEIYEGDIVEYEDYSGGLYLFKKQPKVRGIISIPDLLNGTYLRGLGSFGDGSKVEIVGNVHENPELLD